MFYKLLQYGQKIKIKDEQGHFLETTFYYLNGDIFYNNAVLGNGCKHDFFTSNPDAFTRHCEKMLADGMSITIFKGV